MVSESSPLSPSSPASDRECPGFHFFSLYCDNLIETLTRCLRRRVICWRHFDPIGFEKWNKTRILWRIAPYRTVSAYRFRYYFCPKIYAFHTYVSATGRDTSRVSSSYKWPESRQSGPTLVSPDLPSRYHNNLLTSLASMLGKVLWKSLLDPKALPIK